jgi:hypothetical protein
VELVVVPPVERRAAQVAVPLEVLPVLGLRQAVGLLLAVAVVRRPAVAARPVPAVRAVAHQRVQPVVPRPGPGAEQARQGVAVAGRRQRPRARRRLQHSCAVQQQHGREHLCKISSRYGCSTTSRMPAGNRAR